MSTTVKAKPSKPRPRCQCGKPAMYNDVLCEDCWATKNARFNWRGARYWTRLSLRDDHGTRR